MRDLWTGAQIDPKRVESFMTRFNASTEQACFLIDYISRSGFEEAQRCVATRIMQDNLLYKIGEPYFEGRPEYTTLAADRKSYAKCAARLTVDLLDEFHKFESKEDGRLSTSIHQFDGR